MNKRPIIIDTDPGIDDALAIAIALFSDELDVKLITTVAGNVGLDKVTYNALRLLKYFEREDIPVAMGADSPLIRPYEDASNVHGKSGMEGFDFEEPTISAIKENAVDAMRKVIMESAEPVTLVPIAPLTNIALLLKTYPEVKKNIREIVMMGGSASRGNKGVMSEFNVALDPEAAHMVFHSGVKLTMVGLDVGLKALVLPQDSERIKDMNKTGAMAYCLFKKYRGGSFNTGLKMYDSSAIAYLLAPEMFTAEETYLDVELAGSMTAGCTVVDLKGYLHQDANATVCLDINQDAFRQWFVDSIQKCI
ncbi:MULTISPECIES: ribonucleoside hydrolase RihC [Bacillota]|jgi:non-specific riboncleoside hydrolase|uniref:Ribonucleoside hydrolase RihC n=2 Tax=Amedibacillus TaxID=2749846 RepID=A0A7G9GIR4_9FIRM|nr:MULTISPECIES: ribonucleoside hydrolase RihC [Bacillota]QNM10696.1 ribonucleoside hydrolase RihC [[Eubacterium] hominis]MCH4285660.1 ribonucleoside hydrolase RihC [Amedibacillus hominis]RGB53997.1 ribonucleoside hydrolase RihC [Absiella sp. AM22-9]RGB61244.1 ribonucleoside hydrolase RihC [Absiella sp. AM10-20]RGB63103.1 ribonucleoside hydrolase RihC [Absiella sp. AM09-45]